MSVNIDYYERDRQKHEIVSTFAYLIGVRKAIFENPNSPISMDAYNELDQKKPARIIRNLCLMRVKLINNYKPINDQLIYERKPTSNIYEFPSEEMDLLFKDGLSLFNNKYDAGDYILAINNQINNRIEQCTSYFPTWLNWKYIRKLFLMPGKNKSDNFTEGIKPYYDFKKFYPYQAYLNWDASEDEGNILLHDLRFVTQLYKKNNDEFTDYSKVVNISDTTKSSIDEFIEESIKLVFIVDCENADPYRFISTFETLPEEWSSHISKIILCDDINTPAAWEIFKGHVNIPVEYILTERVRDHKSLVDVRVTAETCKEHYKNDVDSFILVSSDSDYYGLMESLTDARFLVMLEREKASRELLTRLAESGVKYCFTDEFYSGDSDALKQAVILRELRSDINARFQINIKEMLDAAIQRARADFSEAERADFEKKFIKPMHLDVSENGDVRIAFGKA